jgi:CRISPR system Cascade subunit CasC
MRKLFIDVHAIQSIPPSNINRDDTGSPKKAQYGGVTRSRVSSQSWKKAMRDYFNENTLDGNVGIRSLNLVDYVAKEIMNQDSSIEYKDALVNAEKVFTTAGIKLDKDKKLKALLFLSNEQVKALAEASREGIKDKKTLHAIFNDKPSIDIALFGRMVADDPAINEDASAQVAHAISTHGVQTEFDFYTALDDLSPEEHAGAGMLGTIEFNASTLYRYANVNVHELVRKLDNNDDQMLDTIGLFVESFVKSMPTGKVNTFANQTLPSAVVIVCRYDRPVNLVGAYENPVKSTTGFTDKSISSLVEEFERVQSIVKEPAFTLTLGVDDLDVSFDNLPNMLDALKEKVRESLEEK